MRSTNQAQSKANPKDKGKMLFRILQIVTLTLVLELFGWIGSAQGPSPTEFLSPYGSFHEHGTRTDTPLGTATARYLYDSENGNEASVVVFGFGGAVAWSAHGVLYTAPVTGNAEIECELEYYSARGGFGLGSATQRVSAILIANGAYFADELTFGVDLGTGIEQIDLVLHAKTIAEVLDQIYKLQSPIAHRIKRTVPIVQGTGYSIFCGVEASVRAGGGFTAFADGLAFVKRIIVTPQPSGPTPDFAIVNLTSSDPSPQVGSSTNLQVTVKNNGNKGGDAYLKIFVDNQQQGDQVYLGNLAPGVGTQHSRSFICNKEGPHAVRAEVVPAPDEWQRDNNAMEIYITCRDPNPPHVFLKAPINPAIGAPLFKEPGDIIALEVSANDDTAVQGLAFWDEIGGTRYPILCPCTYTPRLPAKSLEARCNWNADRAAKGPHRVYAVAVDSSGNTAEYYQILHIDRDPPVVSFETNPGLMDPPPHLSPAKVVDRKVKVLVSAQDEGYIRKLWWELWSERDTRWQKKGEKDFIDQWQYASAEFDWNTRSLSPGADYKVKACAQDPFWPAGCKEQAVIVDNAPPYKVEILEPKNNATLSAVTFTLKWIVGDSLSGLYGYIPIFRQGDKVEPPKLLDSAIKGALQTDDPDLRLAVNDPSLLGNHAALVNLGLKVIGGITAQGTPIDIEQRAIQFTVSESPQRYTFYVIGVDRVGNYSISEPVTVDVTAIMPRLTVRASCDNARIKVTPPGTTITGPKFGSFTYAQGTTVELEALDQQLNSCGMLMVQSVFKQWEMQVGTSKTTFTTPKIQITLTQDTTATAIYEPAQSAQAKLDVKAVAEISWPLPTRIEISVPVLVNGILVSTPASQLFPVNGLVWLEALQQEVNVPPFGTFYFRQWECESPAWSKVCQTLTIMFTLNEDTVCTVVYVKE
ncbi:MAG: hypothetical protein NUW06_01970 [Candidatus Acetothermia bacterium]|nr:hypothetical protein [Candidatus Acetothermia bacterium]